MPIDEMIEVGLRLAVEGAASGVHTLGSGQSRKAAIIRVVVRLAGLILCAGALWLLIGIATIEVTVPAAIVALAAAGFGAWLATGLSADVRLLRYWGEPNLTAFKAGLKIPGHGVIGWQEILAVEPVVRRRKTTVRIAVGGRRARTLYIASAAPHDLAKAMLAIRNEKGKHP